MNEGIFDLDADEGTVINLTDEDSQDSTLCLETNYLGKRDETPTFSSYSRSGGIVGISNSIKSSSNLSNYTRNSESNRNMLAFGSQMQNASRSYKGTKRKRYNTSNDEKRVSKLTEPGENANPNAFPVFDVESVEHESQEKKKKKKVAKPFLSEEQRKVVDFAASGKSLFFTGVAGTGKSTCLQTVIEELKKKKKVIAVTATTGAAAVLIGGSTIHSWAGIGTGEKEVDDLVGMIRGNKKARENWRDTQTLILDEISMLDPLLFDKLENIARRMRGNDLPFGGLQLILCGDFAQLPPVIRDNYPTRPKFTFQARKWSECIPHRILLTTVHRQKCLAFVKLLNEVRFNRLTEESIKKLKGTKSNDLKNKDGILPTKLFSRNKSVDKMNLSELDKLKGRQFTYKSIDWGRTNAYYAQVKKHSRYPESLKLRIGAQVMLLKNIDTEGGLVNGSRGVVEDIEVDDDEGETIIVRFANGRREAITRDKHKVEEGNREMASRTQFPLQLAWAITIHKAQGISCDLLEVDLRGCFENGQAYVALSRATSFDKLRVLNFHPDCVKASKDVISFYNEMYKENGIVLTLPAADPIESSSSSQFPPTLDIASSSAAADLDDKVIKDSLFAMTGAFKDLSKDEVKKIIEKQGGKFSKTVTKKTNFLIAGEFIDNDFASGKPVSSTAKYKKAISNGIAILDKHSFLLLVAKETSAL